MREGSSEPGRGECFFVVEKTFRTRPKVALDLLRVKFEGRKRTVGHG